MTRTLVTLALLAARPALAERLTVDPQAGNSTFTAVFDARLGERITAQSSAVGCDVRWDEAAGTFSGRCTVPLTSVRVDNEETKTDHFRQWVTNKKSDPATCSFEAQFDRVKIGKLAPETPVPFTAQVPFTVCGRPRDDGRSETVKGTAVLFPAGSYGSARTVRVRATLAGFDRESYRIGPRFTDGWLARVQSLAKVVARRGTIELTLFARAAPAASAASN